MGSILPKNSERGERDKRGHTSLRGSVTGAGTRDPPKKKSRTGRGKRIRTINAPFASTVALGQRKKLPGIVLTACSHFLNEGGGEKVEKGRHLHNTPETAS